MLILPQTTSYSIYLDLIPLYPDFILALWVGAPPQYPTIPMGTELDICELDEDATDLDADATGWS